MGAAYRACYAVLECGQSTDKPGFNEYFSETVKLELAAQPDESIASHYLALANAYRNIEDFLMNK